MTRLPPNLGTYGLRPAAINAMTPEELAEMVLNQTATRNIINLPKVQYPAPNPTGTLQQLVPQAIPAFGDKLPFFATNLPIEQANPLVQAMGLTARNTLPRYQMTDADWAAVAAALGGSVAAGGVLGQLAGGR